jgi:oligo-1,6-glucosidase
MSKKWWKESVVYQIYPRSFMDSNGDGIGDLNGIIGKLDYLALLGVDVIWLSPVYRSPNDDNGYDVSDYFDIMEEFGTLADWDRLLEEIHRRGMKLMMDLVVNHTSDEHKWFVESRSSRDNPYRDYYIWRDGSEKGPPNNWESFFSGSAWELDERTGQYYLHIFSKKQPDLNWDNPKVREDVRRIMTWWLDRGVDGFRMDVINFISKVDGLPSVPGGHDLAHGAEFFMNGPRLLEYLHEMNEKVLSKCDVITVGETPGVTPDHAALFASEDGKALDMVFQFEHMDVDRGPGGWWDPAPFSLLAFKKIMSRWQTELEGKGWNSLYLNNHDQPRAVSRFANDTTYRVESAKMLALCLHFLQGTPYIYQGEEIGMTNVQFGSIDEYDDISCRNMYRERVARGEDPESVLRLIHLRGRDNARTPMQWDDSPNAGFTSGDPWLGVNPNYREVNVKASLEDKNSVFHFYKRLIELRKEHAVIVYGSYELLLPDHDQVYAYTRTLGAQRVLVLCNFSEDTVRLPEDLVKLDGELLIANYTESGESHGVLRPYEARAYLHA